jgi:hypothetical protein
MRMEKNTRLKSSFSDRLFGMSGGPKKIAPHSLIFVGSEMEPFEVRIRPRSAQAVELLHESLSGETVR